MNETITNLGILAAKADKRARDLEKAGEFNQAIVQRRIAERYRLCMASQIRHDPRKLLRARNEAA